jgi:hypothetical protein
MVAANRNIVTHKTTFNAPQNSTPHIHRSLFDRIRCLVLETTSRLGDSLRKKPRAPTHGAGRAASLIQKR